MSNDVADTIASPGATRSGFTRPSRVGPGLENVDRAPAAGVPPNDEKSFDVSEVASNNAGQALRYLWARNRIADLSDFGDSRETDEGRRELVSLGLTYNLLTRHTSFIAVHEQIRNPLALGEDVVQPLALPAGVSDHAVGGMVSGDEPGLAWLLSLVLVAGFGVWLLRRTSAAGV